MRVIRLPDETRCTVASSDRTVPSTVYGPNDVTMLVTSDVWPVPRVMVLDASWVHWPDTVLATAIAGRLALGAWSAATDLDG